MLEYLRERLPWVMVVANEANMGFAGGANRGILQARGRAHPHPEQRDTWADRFVVERLAKPMKADGAVGMGASKILFPDGRIRINPAISQGSSAKGVRSNILERESSYPREFFTSQCHFYSRGNTAIISLPPPSWPR